MIGSWFEFFLLSIASFRLTRLLVFDKITIFIRRPFIEEYEETESDGSISTYFKIKGSGLRSWMGELLSCYWCTGIWCAAFLYIGWLFLPHLFKPVIIILAIAGTAAIIETVIHRIIE